MRNEESDSNLQENGFQEEGEEGRRGMKIDHDKKGPRNEEEKKERRSAKIEEEGAPPSSPTTTTLPPFIPFLLIAFPFAMEMKLPSSSLSFSLFWYTQKRLCYERG